MVDPQPSQQQHAGLFNLQPFWYFGETLNMKSDKVVKNSALLHCPLQINYIFVKWVLSWKPISNEIDILPTRINWTFRAEKVSPLFE